MPPASLGSVASRVALFDSQQQALFRQWITSPAAGYVRQNLDGTPYHHPQPTLTDAEREAISIVRACAIARAERFLTQSDREWEATLTLVALLERLG